MRLLGVLVSASALRKEQQDRWWLPPSRPGDSLLDGIQSLLRQVACFFFVLTCVTLAACLATVSRRIFFLLGRVLGLWGSVGGCGAVQWPLVCCGTWRTAGGRGLPRWAEANGLGSGAAVSWARMPGAREGIQRKRRMARRVMRAAARRGRGVDESEYVHCQQRCAVRCGAVGSAVGRGSEALIASWRTLYIVVRRWCGCAAGWRRGGSRMMDVACVTWCFSLTLLCN